MKKETFACQECGRKFRSVKAAEKAAFNGCPKCGGVDIDLDVELERESEFAISGAFGLQDIKKGIRICSFCLTNRI
jgi:hypothetical protein